MNVEFTQDQIKRAEAEMETATNIPAFMKRPPLRANMLEIMTLGLWLADTLDAHPTIKFTDKQIEDAQFALGQWCVGIVGTEDRKAKALEMYEGVIAGTADQPGEELGRKINDHMFGPEKKQ